MEVVCSLCNVYVTRMLLVVLAWCFSQYYQGVANTFFDPSKGPISIPDGSRTAAQFEDAFFLDM